MADRTMRQFKLGALGALAALLAACGAESGKSYPPLTESKAPAGFDFATSRPVEVRISSATRGALRLSSADGKLLFSGTLDPKLPLVLKLPIASKETKLVAELRGGGASSVVDLAILGGSAVHAFN